MNKLFITAMFITAMLMSLSTQRVLAGPLVDPTRPASAHAPVSISVNTFRLEGIVISATTQWAIVNGTVVHRGDHIANALIEDISRFSVRYSRNGHSELALLTHSTLQVRRNDSAHEDSP
jgi:hypothetical protein